MTDAESRLKMAKETHYKEYAEPAYNGKTTNHKGTMTMKTTEQKIKEIRAKAREEIKTVKAEGALMDCIPSHPATTPAGQSWRIHIVNKHEAWAKLAPSSYNGQRLTLKEAQAVRLSIGSIETAEHWIDGCRSVAPVDINKYATAKNGQMDGASVAEICVDYVAKSAGTTSLIWWARLACGLVKFTVEIIGDWSWAPGVVGKYDINGDWYGTITPRFIGEDQRVKWWSPVPSYRISYYWADEINFNSWLSKQK